MRYTRVPEAVAGGKGDEGAAGESLLILDASVAPEMHVPRMISAHGLGSARREMT